ncbi:ComE operon protein 1 [Burkholderia sp. AD24]|nr:ComE operon protein 1 [Burkholderia sp. AD24]
MLKKLLMLCVALALSLSAGFAAAVEVNSADQAALESVKGIGPVHAKAIIDERTKNGPFKDADDLAARVKGIGAKSVTNLEAAGLTINGSATPPSGAKAATKSGGSASTKAAPAATSAAASAPADASGTKASKKKAKKSKAASAAAASGGA